MRILLIRHGDPDYEKDWLTEAGEREAAALAAHLRREGLDRIYCSPLGRARRTAWHTAQALGREAIVEDWTAELGGWRIDELPHDVHMAWDLHGEVIRERRPLPGQHDWHDHPAYGGRGFADGFARIAEASDAFIARHGYQRVDGRYRIVRPNQERIALFCHGGFGLTWLAHLLELPPPLVWSGFFMPTSSVTTILFDERSREWAVPRCLGVGDLSHLACAGLPMSGAGIKANRR